jgi:hypothetical protein
LADSSVRFPPSVVLNVGPITRRGFVAGTAAFGLAAIVRPEIVSSAQTNSKITLGLIGCGGRGNWIANLFNQIAKAANVRVIFTCAWMPFAGRFEDTMVK